MQALNTLGQLITKGSRRTAHYLCFTNQGTLPILSMDWVIYPQMDMFLSVQIL